ncbi:NAD-dependent epimerase/dehydratase family protein [Chryseobacterium daecheongense]|uniref:NAD-dependent epimerase/dehydratase family protein n=1 Tax=Chryseobacterium daecheongense TaxID=192389 RepID=A0A3N0VXS8_9FLAO|nr:NAD-dependent epimerase/dehydratase family protein [Chryseobacterium daecheongense]ROH97623.1 NAD-dependent epimerase/dehydratase family protein [Chryseobacterium daecheongense]TDX93225.1 nucleoside-diphosphate-sugar epimerase [Chryseobacterium daecheongense]
MKRILITGITGYIGGTVAKKLLDKNYTVIGLIRNDVQAKELEAAGIETIVGNIHDEEVLQSAISNADAIIHNADSADDAYVADSIVKALEGSGKTFIFTSGSAIFGGKENGEKNDFVFTEDIPLQPRLEMASRVLINQHILQSARKNVRSIVIVPTMVYGEGLGIKKDSIQVPALINFSKEKGFGAYFGKGENIWSNVHIEDLADLYVLALEKAKAGSLYYAENGSSTIKNLAERISERYELLPAQSVTVQEAVNKFGPAGGYFGFASNSLCNADKARTELNWKPQHQSIEQYI